MFKGVAIYQKDVALPAENVDELVHNPALHSHELILGSLREPDKLKVADLQIVEVSHRERHTRFERRRG